MDIGKGDWVECIDASPCGVCGDPGLVIKALYRVEEIGRIKDNFTGFECMGVRLFNFNHPLGLSGTRGWLGAPRFRLIHRSSESLILQLLQPIHEDA